MSAEDATKAQTEDGKAGGSIRDQPGRAALLSVAQLTGVTPSPYLDEFKSKYLNNNATRLEWRGPALRGDMCRLQYGVEIETTIAFHQSHIRFYRMGDRTKRRIVKEIPLDVRKHLNPAAKTDPSSRASRPEYYQGWAVLTDDDEYLFMESWIRLRMRHKKFLEEVVDRDHAPVLRTWWPEPLHVIEDICERRREIEVDKGKNGDSVGQKLMVRANMKKQLDKSEGDMSYNVWTVTNDQTLVSAPRKMLRSILELNGLVKSEDESRMWDSCGVEIVTRILQAEDSTDFREIDWVTDTLNNENGELLAFQSPFTGLHVHVGFNEYLQPIFEERHKQWLLLPQGANGKRDPPEVDMARPGDHFMGILQHLAYILLSFEHVFVQLVPPHQRGIEGSLSEGDCRSNRAYFLGKLSEEKGRSPTVTDVWNAIWELGITVPALMNKLQGKRGVMVNFENIAKACEAWGSTAITTVEFRFHEGTHDAVKIQNFAMLCVAMIRAAERKVMADTFSNGKRIPPDGKGVAHVEGKKHLIQDGSGDFEEQSNMFYTLDLFFGLLQLDEMQQWYWKARFDYFPTVAIEVGDTWKEDYTGNDPRTYLPEPAGPDEGYREEGDLVTEPEETEEERATREREEDEFERQLKEQHGW